MKTRYIVPFFFLSCISTQAQVLIDRHLATSASVTLEFGTQTRGILLEPATLPASPSAGTIIFDDSTASLRYYNGSSWSTAATGGTINTVVDYTTTSQVIINSTFSSATGLFIIEATNRALVLPKLSNGLLAIKSPTPGLLYYDTLLKAMMVYNGNLWVAY